MQIIPILGGRFILYENEAEMQVFMQLSLLIKDLEDPAKLSKKERKRLQQAWLNVEYLAQEILPMTAGFKREEIFD